MEWIDNACNENRHMIYVLKNLNSKKLVEMSHILEREFPESTITSLCNKRLNMIDVIIFENVEDTLAFKLRYGHEYGAE